MKSLPSAVPSSPGTLTFAGSQSIDILERRTWGPLPEMIHRAAPGALAGVELSHLSPPWLTEGPQGLWSVWKALFTSNHLPSLVTLTSEKERDWPRVTRGEIHVRKLFRAPP